MTSQAEGKGRVIIIPSLTSASGSDSDGDNKSCSSVFTQRKVNVQGQVYFGSYY